MALSYRASGSAAPQPSASTAIHRCILAHSISRTTRREQCDSWGWPMLRRRTVDKEVNRVELDETSNHQQHHPLLFVKAEMSFQIPPSPREAGDRLSEEPFLFQPRRKGASGTGQTGVPSEWRPRFGNGWRNRHRLQCSTAISQLPLGHQLSTLPTQFKQHATRCHPWAIRAIPGAFGGLCAVFVCQCLTVV